MRGKRGWDNEPIELERNIPAYAGKTYLKELNAQEEAEHPRVCGENAAPEYKAASDPGTSPRMRGKPCS